MSEYHGVKHLAVALIAAGIIHVHQLTGQENKQAKELACQIALSPLARIKDAAHHLALEIIWWAVDGQLYGCCLV